MGNYSSKNYSVLLHTPEPLLHLYGRAVRGELPSPLLPLWQATSGLLRARYRHRVSLHTVALLPARPIYRGTSKHYSVRNVLYGTILSEVSKIGNVRDEYI